MKKKNVAILLTTKPEFGGEHRYLQLLMECLAKCDGRYFHVLGICYNLFWVKWCREHDIDYVRDQKESYSYRFMEMNARFPLFFKFYNAYKLPLGKIIFNRKIDLIIGGRQDNFIPSLFCKKIQLVHDLMHRYEPHFLEILEGSKGRESIFSNGARIADIVLVDSELGKKQYLECYYNNWKHNPKIEVLPYVASINGKKEEYIETPPKYIFYPAQFWQHKNHANLIMAVNLLKEKIPDIQLLLVGSEKNSLQKVLDMVKAYSLEKRVFIFGFVSDAQLVYLYRHAVAMVMPTYFGPTNIPPLEAMALGCPVIASGNYAMEEQIGDAGLLCNPDSPTDIAKCISKVWNDDVLRQIMKERGYERAKNWGKKDFKKQFLKIVMRELYH